MTGDANLKLRVGRLENDTQSLYELVTEIRSTLHEHTKRFGTVDERFDAVDKHFDAVNERFDAVNERFDAVNERFDVLATALSEVVRRLPEPS